MLKYFFLSCKYYIFKNCPSCKTSNIFYKYLKLSPHCPNCGVFLEPYKADDGPAWVTMMVVGHLFLPFMVSMELKYTPPLLFSLTAWPIICILFCLWVLPIAKTYFIHRLFCQDSTVNHEAK